VASTSGCRFLAIAGPLPPLPWSARTLIPADKVMDERRRILDNNLGFIGQDS
jgi:hypothetical protein